MVGCRGLIGRFTVLCVSRSQWTSVEEGRHVCEVRAVQDAAGQFRFHLKSANGEVIAASQGYTSKAAAQNGISAINDNAATAATEDQT